MRQVVFLIMVVAFCGATFSSCQNHSDNFHETELSQIERNENIEVILNRASITLDNISDPFDRASSLSELAVAFDADNQSDRGLVLFDSAISEASNIEDPKIRSSALSQILDGLFGLRPNKNVLVLEQQIGDLAKTLPSDQIAGITAKRVLVRGRHGSFRPALDEATALPEQTSSQQNAKAVTLRKISEQLALSGDLVSAERALREIQMSISYYQAMARSDVARAAFRHDDSTLAETLLAQADVIARDQENGYFVGAALRDIAYAYRVAGYSEKADSYFEDAVTEAGKASKLNERARAISRIATRYADAEDYANSRAVLDIAVLHAKDIEPGPLRGYTYYEIAGSAAFNGEFELAFRSLEHVPDTPLQSTKSILGAAQRDVAWGLARHGRIEDALDVCARIASERERVQAYSRIVRLLRDPDMSALPRYL